MIKTKALDEQMDDLLYFNCWGRSDDRHFLQIGGGFVEIRMADRGDLGQLADLAVRMWTEHVPEELEAEFSAVMEAGGAFFLALDGGMAVGFAQCQLRHDYVEGTSGSPVGYLEGIFVAESHRRRGTAKMLLAACESWAAEQGCREFASDCELDNRESLEFHLKMGFEEANRIICFTKKL